MAVKIVKFKNWYLKILTATFTNLEFEYTKDWTCNIICKN